MQVLSKELRKVWPDRERRESRATTANGYFTCFLTCSICGISQRLLPFSRLNHHSTVPASFSSGTDLTFCVAFLPKDFKQNSSQDIHRAAETTTRLKPMQKFAHTRCATTLQAAFPLPALCSLASHNRINTDPGIMEGTEGNNTFISSRRAKGDQEEPVGNTSSMSQPKPGYKVTTIPDFRSTWTCLCSHL